MYTNAFHKNMKLEKKGGMKNMKFQIGDSEYKAFINDMSNPDSVSLVDEGSIELLDLKSNREYRRHGPFGSDGYKQPRSNKKLYEY